MVSVEFNISPTFITVCQPRSVNNVTGDIWRECDLRMYTIEGGIAHFRLKLADKNRQCTYIVHIFNIGDFMRTNKFMANDD